MKREKEQDKEQFRRTLWRMELIAPRRKRTEPLQSVCQDIKKPEEVGHS